MYNFIEDARPIAAGFDIKKRVTDFLNGKEGQPARGRWIVFQKVRRDEKGDPVKSPFTYKITEETNHTSRGTATTRQGFLCDEFLIRAFVVPSGRLVMDEVNSAIGMLATNRVIVMTEAQNSMRQHDVAILIKTDDNGNPINPVQIEKEYLVTVPYEKHLYNGRNEYNMVIAEVIK